MAGQFCGICVHTHRGQRATSGSDLPYALYLRQLLLDDGGGFVIQCCGTVFVRGKTEDHDRRIGGIDFAIDRISRQVGWQIGSRRIDSGLHIARRAIDVAAEVELNGNRCAAESACGGHLRHTCNMTELPLQGSGDGRRHNVGAGSRQACTDGNSRKVDFRQGRYRQHLKRNRPGKGNRHREQRRGHRPANKGFGDVHAGPASSAPPVSGWVDFFAKRCARLSKKM